MANGVAPRLVAQDPDRAEAGESDGRVLTVAHDFARLRKRLLALVARRAPGDRATIAAIRAEMRLSDREFGELWAACSCNGDFVPRREKP